MALSAMRRPTVTKLSDTQLILLSAAARRSNLSLYPLAKTGTGIAKAVASLATRGLVEGRETDEASAIHRREQELTHGLFVTTAGLAALGIEPAQERPGEALAGTAPLAVGSAERAASDPTTIPPSGKSGAPRATKAALVLDLLHRGEGATLAELIAATGWLPHTTRAALTGLRKKGHTIIKGQRGGTTFYSIANAG
jgi:hypothetical protein